LKLCGFSTVLLGKQQKPCQDLSLKLHRTQPYFLLFKNHPTKTTSHPKPNPLE
jgi:hypothetical protein